MKEVVINYTKHPIHIFNDTGAIIKVLPRSGKNARVGIKVQRNDEKLMGCIPTSTVYIDSYSDEPPPYQENVKYVVSHHFKTHFPDRDDIYTCVEQKRCSNGKVIGCRSITNNIKYAMEVVMQEAA